MDEFLERLTSTGGILALIALPWGLAQLYFDPAGAGTRIALIAGAIGVAIYFIGSAIQNKND
jgi:hypothetical protein